MTGGQHNCFQRGFEVHEFGGVKQEFCRSELLLTHYERFVERGMRLVRMSMNFCDDAAVADEYRASGINK